MGVEELAKDFYDFYHREVGGLTLNGRPLPDWESFKNNPDFKKHFSAWMLLTAHATQVLVTPQILDAAKTQRLMP